MRVEIKSNKHIRSTMRIFGVVAVACILQASIVHCGTRPSFVSDDMIAMAASVVNACQTETGVSTADIEAVRNGQWSDERSLKCYMYCLWEQFGLVDDKRELSLNGMLTFFQRIPAFRAEVLKAVNTCKRIVIPEDHVSVSNTSTGMGAILLIQYDMIDATILLRTGNYCSLYVDIGANIRYGVLLDPHASLGGLLILVLVTGMIMTLRKLRNDIFLHDTRVIDVIRSFVFVLVQLAYFSLLFQLMVTTANTHIHSTSVTRNSHQGRTICFNDVYLKIIVEKNIKVKMYKTKLKNAQ